MKEVQVNNELIRKVERNGRRSEITGQVVGKAYKDSGSRVKSGNSKVLLDADQDNRYPFFTEKAFLDMALGKIPDFEPIYQGLSDILAPADAALSAIQFLPVLRQFTFTDSKEINNFLKNPETNHVLVQNDQIKIVLIRWQPGAESSIHGHAVGGCVFKVLYGKIVEKRYSVDGQQKLLAESTYQKDNIAYIDDTMGLHSVGNPFSTPAISLHMYTPGHYKPNKK